MRLETHGSNSSSMPGSRSKPVLYPENFRLGAIQQQGPGIDHVNRFVLPEACHKDPTNRFTKPACRFSSKAPGSIMLTDSCCPKPVTRTPPIDSRSLPADLQPANRFVLPRASPQCLSATFHSCPRLTAAKFSINRWWVVIVEDF